MVHYPVLCLMNQENNLTANWYFRVDKQLYQNASKLSYNKQISWNNTDLFNSSLRSKVLSANNELKTSLACGALNIVLTVAVVAGVDAAFKSLHLCKLGQHLSEGAATLVSRRARAFVYAVVSLWKLQRQIPEWLYCVRLVLTG